MVEFTIVALPLMLAGFGVFESSRWFLARQAVGYALYEAARSGSVSGADPQAIKIAFERGLAPLLAPAGPVALDQLDTRMRRYISTWRLQHSLPIARIEQISPNPRSFDDFSDPALNPPGAARAINNSYQLERHLSVQSRRYPQGIGPRSGQTLFEANTLVLRLTYLHRPLVPGIRTLIRSLPSPENGDDYIRRARIEGGMLLIRREISMPMQSHPREYASGNTTFME